MSILLFSRRITHVYCPNLSEKLAGARTSEEFDSALAKLIMNGHRRSPSNEIKLSYSSDRCKGRRVEIAKEERSKKIEKPEADFLRAQAVNAGPNTWSSRWSGLWRVFG